MGSLGGAIAEERDAHPFVDAGVNTGWYVVQTKRYREQVAQRFLDYRGVVSYLPRIVQWPPPAVGGEVAPMFPGYLFVHAAWEDDFQRIASTPGIKSFVSFGEQPPALDTAVIEFLRGREGPDGLIRCGSSLEDHCQVEIINGPFRGLTAVLQEALPARERVRVLLQILQRETRVEIPAKWVRRA
jgi:transcription termination factor NusG